MSEKTYTDEEAAQVAARRGLPCFAKLALRQEGLSRKAKEEPRFKFYNLYSQVFLVDTLRCAWEQARANKGTAGVDHVTFEDIERSEGGVDGFLTSIQQELKAKTYRASPVKRVYIEKANGKLRPLGIPTVKDRVVQTAVKLVIEPIFEADFHDAKGTGQAMTIVRYADDFVILAREWKDGFRQKVENAIEGRFGLVVNRDKTRCVDMKAPHESLSFLGYEFRFCKSRSGFRYLRYGPSKKSIKKVCAKIKEQTRSDRGLVPVDETICAMNRIIDGWGRYFRCGSPAEMFGKVNEYVQLRLYIWLNRRSQRGYELKYAKTYYGELKHMGLISLTRKRYRQ